MRVFLSKLSSGTGGRGKINRKKRIEALRAAASKAGAGASAVFGKSSIYYFTGSVSGGVFLAGENEPVLFAPAVNYQQAKNTVELPTKVESFSGSLPFGRILGRFEGKKVLCDSAEVSHAFALKLSEEFSGEIIYKREYLKEMRMIKDDEETGFIEEACMRSAEIVDNIDINEWIGTEEALLASHLQARSWENGCGGTAFDPVVAAGVNTSFPHHTPGGDKITAGPVKIDYGVKFSQYSSDLTRTFILNKLDKNQFFLSILDKVREAKREAEKILRPGTKCSEVYRAAAGVFEKYELQKYFVHNLGHGLGIDIHEKPSLSPASEEVLRSGMVVTVEPGLYIPSRGGLRLEDAYLITAEGSRRLTRKYR